MAGSCHASPRGGPCTRPAQPAPRRARRLLFRMRLRPHPSLGPKDGASPGPSPPWRPRWRAVSASQGRSLWPAQHRRRLRLTPTPLRLGSPRRRLRGATGRTAGKEKRWRAHCEAIERAQGVGAAAGSTRTMWHRGLLSPCALHSTERRGRRVHDRNTCEQGRPLLPVHRMHPQSRPQKPLPRLASQQTTSERKGGGKARGEKGARRADGLARLCGALPEASQERPGARSHCTPSSAPP